VRPHTVRRPRLALGDGAATRVGSFGVKGALQLLMNRYGSIRFAQVPEQVSTTKSFVVLIIGNSKSNHFGAQGILKSMPFSEL